MGWGPILDVSTAWQTALFGGTLPYVSDDPPAFTLEKPHPSVDAAILRFLGIGQPDGVFGTINVYGSSRILLSDPNTPSAPPSISLWFHRQLAALTSPKLGEATSDSGFNIAGGVLFVGSGTVAESGYANLLDKCYSPRVTSAADPTVLGYSEDANDVLELHLPFIGSFTHISIAMTGSFEATPTVEQFNVIPQWHTPD